MKMTSGMFGSASQHWATPADLYKQLDKEFNFNHDPCPLLYEQWYNIDGLQEDWGTVSYCNPPYGREITKWLAKGYEEYKKGKTIVFLVPSRTDTRWWHDYCMKADEIRFLRGRLKFGGSKNSAPFPSAVVIFYGKY